MIQNIILKKDCHLFNRFDWFIAQFLILEFGSLGLPCMSRGNLPYSYSSLIAKSKEHLKRDSLKIDNWKRRPQTKVLREEGCLSD